MSDNSYQWLSGWVGDKGPPDICSPNMLTDSVAPGHLLTDMASHTHTHTHTHQHTHTHTHQLEYDWWQIVTQDFNNLDLWISMISTASTHTKRSELNYFFLKAMHQCSKQSDLCNGWKSSLQGFCICHNFLAWSSGGPHYCVQCVCVCACACMSVHEHVRGNLRHAGEQKS